MGYEMKFIIGIKNPNMKEQIEEGEYSYVQTLATYNYSGSDAVANFTEKYPRSECYAFITNEDKEDIKDKYGEEFKSIDIDEFIDFLEHNDTDYRRNLPFLNMLKGFRDNRQLFDSDWQKLVVLRYGY